MSTADRTRERVGQVWRAESARIVAGLARLVGDVGLAEELAHDALVAALEQWPRDGVPDNPGAWLTAVAKRRAVDHVRRARRRELVAERAARAAPPAEDREDAAEEGADVLRLMFVAAHPVLPTEARVALTLRLVGGLTAAETARAFLVGESTIARRVADAKRTLAEAGVAFALPDPAELGARLASVLEVVYLVFNEGYSATEGDDLLRPDLCAQAMRLGGLLAAQVPDEPEVHGLLALMELQASRAAARTDPAGRPVPLHEQDRGRWDTGLVRRGFGTLLRARGSGRPPGPYVLQAAIAACHARARAAGDTDWAQITALYDALGRVLPTPVVRLNRAVAVGMARGPAAGLADVDALADDPALLDYHLLPAVRGDLLARLGRGPEARLEFHRAADLARNSAERAFLLGRAAQLRTAPGGDVPVPDSLDAHVCAFLDRPDLDPATARAYGQTLARLCTGLGGRRPAADVTAGQVAAVVRAAWGRAAPATWNRHRAAVRAFASWTGHDLAAALDPRPVERVPAPGLDRAGLDRLCADPAVGLRERTLWRLLAESGAAVRDVLGLDVEQLDLADRRARVGGRWVSWRSATAALLPDVLGDRTRGPLFLTGRRAGPAARDVCPDTGRRRLSYERAEQLFKRATRGLDPAARGFTLGGLRRCG